MELLLRSYLIFRKFNHKVHCLLQFILSTFLSRRSSPLQLLTSFPHQISTQIDYLPPCLAYSASLNFAILIFARRDSEVLKTALTSESVKFVCEQFFTLYGSQMHA